MRWSDECSPGDQSVTANNATGFSAVPAGYCDGSSFPYEGDFANFWSATQHASYPYDAYSRNLTSSWAGVFRNTSLKYYGFSVRCLRD